MKRWLLFPLVLALASLSAHAQQVSTQYKTINWKWTAAANTGSLPVCASGVTKSCVKDYLLVQIDPTGVVQAGIPVPFTSTSYAFSPGGFLYCGTWPATLVTEYYDDTSTLKQSSPATGQAVVSCPFVAPGSPSGFGGTPGL